MKTISRIVSVVGRNLAIALACAALGTATNAGVVSLVSKSYMDGETAYLTTNGVTVMSGWTLPEGTTVKLSARGDTNIRRVQDIDDASWIWMPGCDVWGVQAECNAWTGRPWRGVRIAGLSSTGTIRAMKSRASRRGIPTPRFSGTAGWSCRAVIRDC